MKTEKDIEIKPKSARALGIYVITSHKDGAIGKMWYGPWFFYKWRHRYKNVQHKHLKRAASEVITQHISVPLKKRKIKAIKLAWMIKFSGRSIIFSIKFKPKAKSDYGKQTTKI